MREHTPAIELRTGRDLPFDQLLALYESVGWVAYTNEDRRADLPRAVRNSTYVVSAWHRDTLVGLARGLSDDVSILYLQDILVRPAFQRQGIGRQLLDNVLARFRHVRTVVLLTDDRAQQLQFYASAGFVNTRDLTAPPLNAFVRIDGLNTSA